MKTNEIKITRDGIVISNHPDGVVCTYDSRHRILKVPMEDGSIFELFQERADSGNIRAEYRTELMTTMAPRGAPSEARVNDGGRFPEG
jgi:hypothetical protein